MDTGAYDAFSTWLRAQMRMRGMTQRQLAERSGVHHSTISRVIAGRRSVNLQTAARIAASLGTQADTQEGWPYLRGSVQDQVSDIARVEYALRADGLLREQHVREVMAAYLRVRRRLAPDRPLPSCTIRPVATAQTAT